VNEKLGENSRGPVGGIFCPGSHPPEPAGQCVQPLLNQRSAGHGRRSMDQVRDPTLANLGPANRLVLHSTSSRYATRDPFTTAATPVYLLQCHHAAGCRDRRQVAGTAVRKMVANRNRSATPFTTLLGSSCTIGSPTHERGTFSEVTIFLHALTKIAPTLTIFMATLTKITLTLTKSFRRVPRGIFVSCRVHPRFFTRGSLDQWG
jgi:hypothetical protein